MLTIQCFVCTLKIDRERRGQNAWQSTLRYWDSLRDSNKPVATLLSHTFTDSSNQTPWILEAGSFLLSSALFLYPAFACRAPPTFSAAYVTADMPACSRTASFFTLLLFATPRHPPAPLALPDSSLLLPDQLLFLNPYVWKGNVGKILPVCWLNPVMQLRTLIPLLIRWMNI